MESKMIFRNCVLSPCSHKKKIAIDAGKVYNSGKSFYHNVKDGSTCLLSGQAKSPESIGKVQFRNAELFHQGLDECGRLQIAPGHTFKGGKIKSNMLGNVNPFFHGKDLMGYDIYLNTNHDGNVFPQVFVQGKWMNLLTKTMSYRDFAYHIIDFGISSNYRRQENFTTVGKYFSIVRFCMSKSFKFKLFVYANMIITGILTYKFPMITSFMRISNILSNIIRIMIPFIGIFMIYIYPCVRKNAGEQFGYSIENMRKSKKTLECLENFDSKIVYPGREYRGVTYDGKTIKCNSEISEEVAAILQYRFENLRDFFNQYLKTPFSSVKVNKCSNADIGHLKAIICPDISDEEWSNHVTNAYMYSKENDARSVIIGIYYYFMKLNYNTNLNCDVIMTSDFFKNEDCDTPLFCSILYLLEANIELWGGTWYDRWLGIPCYKNLLKEIESLKIC